METLDKNAIHQILKSGDKAKILQALRTFWQILPDNNFELAKEVFNSPPVVAKIAP